MINQASGAAELPETAHDFLRWEAFQADQHFLAAMLKPTTRTNRGNPSHATHALRSARARRGFALPCECVAMGQTLHYQVVRSNLKGWARA